MSEISRSVDAEDKNSQGRKENGKKGMGVGPGGKCLCPNCGATWPHLAGRPCTGIICRECGSQMMRQR